MICKINFCAHHFVPIGLRLGGERQQNFSEALLINLIYVIYHAVLHALAVKERTTFSFPQHREVSDDPALPRNLYSDCMNNG